MTNKIWTPTKLASYMVGKIDPKYSRYILEPHAGVGSLVDEIAKLYPKKNIVCGEIDFSLVVKLRLKGYTAIHEDFLKVSHDYSGVYSTIIMAPPFCDNMDATHILHAWNLMYEGDVISMVSAKTLREPKLPIQHELADLVERYGEKVEYISDAFEDTDVEIALIHLKKRKR